MFCRHTQTWSTH